MKKIIHDLYRGRLPGWDNSRSNTESDETREKIVSARKHLISILPADALERFKTLEALHNETHARRYRNTYMKAFRLGVMLMCAVFMNDDEEAEK